MKRNEFGRTNLFSFLLLEVYDALSADYVNKILCNVIDEVLGAVCLVGVCAVLSFMGHGDIDW